MKKFKCKHFDLDKIYYSGQVLVGWHMHSPYHYEIVSAGRVMNAWQEGDTITFDCPDGDNAFWDNYFDMQTDYEAIEKALDFSSDAFMTESLEYGRGIRILRQDLWETIISFIVSQNNNIPRITKSIDKIKGESVAFPSYEELYSKKEILKDCGLGYRDEYIARLVTELHEKKRELIFSESTEAAYKELLDIHGIGPKVANCILLFGMHRMDRCPVDTWIKKIFEKYYEGAAAQWTKHEYAGYYQQVAFFYERNKK